MHSYINIPRLICQSLIGKSHETHHRIAVGGFLMCTGVLIAQGGHLVEIVVFKATLDLVGYTLHGVGIVPFLEWLLESDKDDPPPMMEGMCTATALLPRNALVCAAR